jgi:cell division protein ZapE
VPGQPRRPLPALTDDTGKHPPATLRAIYEERLRTSALTDDPHQREALQALQRVADDCRVPPPPGLLARWRRPPPAPRGVYLWGGVGRGKTWLMDLFHDALGDLPRGRLHFHRFLQQVHGELARIRGRADPLRVVARGMATRWRLLCLDEFNVVDIGDAMILAGLLRGLFENGVTLVTTSNRPPEALYPDGLQRASFLPAIDLLYRHTQVVGLDGERDYRTQLLEASQVFHTPLGDATDARLHAEFVRLSGVPGEGPGELSINGRRMPYRRRAGDMVWFDFEALCGPPRSQNDYIELARCHHTVFVSDIPVLGGSRDDRTRRFIFLIDEFYDRHVKLVLSAEMPPAQLYVGERLAFEFQRTASRLAEMQTAAFLRRPHIG